MRLRDNISGELDTGVREGSIQGPVLFISITPVSVTAMITNERLKRIRINAVTFTVEYADDSTGMVIGEIALHCQMNF